MMQGASKLVASGDHMHSIQAMLSQLRAAKKHKEAEKRRLEGDINQIDKAIERLEKTLKEEGGLVAKLQQEGLISLPMDYPEPKRERGILSPDAIASEVRQLLLELKRPMTRGQIVQELEFRGIPLSGKDKNKNLGTILWRHKHQFVQLAKLGYWVRDVPLEGVYAPDE
jgi:hypothetical protein